MVEVTASYQITEKAKEHATVHIAFPRIQERWSYLLVKRLFDFFFALIGLIVLAIPMAIIALIIVFDSPGGAIFKQERLGKGGKPFVIYKFRTMNHDAEVNGPKWADKEDKRCTRFGAFLRKTRIDELPQLWNILVGDMSFVGPRPERQYFYEQFEKYIVGFSNRLVVTPGLTGYAQVNVSRTGCERIIRYAFETARKEKRSLTSISKANALNYSMVFWDQIFQELSAEYPDVETHSYMSEQQQAHPTTTESELIAVRRDKLAKIRELGIDPYGARFDVTTTPAGLKADFQA